MKQHFKKLIPDRENSRFKWKINLIDVTRQPYIMGYSKIINNPEAADRFVVFKNKIIMLHERGYLDKAISIEFMDNQTFEVLAILAQKTYSHHPKLLATKENEFLKEFYHRRNNKLDMNYFSSPRINFSKEEFLVPVKLGKVGKDRFVEYTNALGSMGFDNNQINDFRYNYQKIYGNFI